MIRTCLTTWLLHLLLMVGGSTSAQQPLPAGGDETQLIATLESDTDLFDKAKACQRLAIIGTSESIPILARFLGDEELSHYARFGLESNPSSDVDVALRNALGNLTGAPLVGVINSIGVRRDREAVNSLVELTRDDDQEVAAAAICSLGAIASPEAVDAILQAVDGDEARKVIAADACLTAADRLLVEGNNSQAATIFTSLGQADLPKQIDVAWRFGQIRSGSEDVTALMTQYLSSEDHDLFRIGLELAHQIPGEETTRGLLQQMKSMTPSRQVLLLYIRVIRQFGLRTNERLKMSKQAFGAATRDEERKLVLDTYTRFPAASSLNAVMPHLSNPALSEQASRAAVMICEKIVNTDRKAVTAAMPRILATTRDPEIINRADVVASQAGMN